MTYKFFVNGQPVDELTDEQRRILTDNFIAAIPGARKLTPEEEEQRRKEEEDEAAKESNESTEADDSGSRLHTR